MALHYRKEVERLQVSSENEMTQNGHGPIFLIQYFISSLQWCILKVMRGNDYTFGAV
jgi:hypothetical protein